MVSGPSSSSSSRRCGSGWSGEYLSPPPVPMGAYHDKICVDADRCHCGFVMPIHTSMTPQNPYRRFRKCLRKTGLTRGCGLWEWLDDEYSESSKDVINHLEASKRNLEATVAALKKTILEKDKVLNSLRVEIDEHDVKTHDIVKSGAMQKESCKMYLKWQSRFIMVLLLAVLILIKK